MCSIRLRSSWLLRVRLIRKAPGVLEGLAGIIAAFEMAGGDERVVFMFNNSSERITNSKNQKHGLAKVEDRLLLRNRLFIPNPSIGDRSPGGLELDTAKKADVPGHGIGKITGDVAADEKISLRT